ncbi:MAG: N-formylglutamate deformylase [Rhodovibrionaceae bacterium]
MEPFSFTRRNAPLLVSMPHVGTKVPEEIVARFTPEAAILPDTDWHVDRLYDFLEGLGATVITARYSRYVIDLNRAPDNRALYKGANNTELCPTTTFAEQAIYRAGEAPGAAEVESRRESFWQPYHARLAETLAEMTAAHGRVLLWDAHSIRSRVPRFFEGRLPDLNLGTAGGESADPGLEAALLAEAEGIRGYSHVLNGRFKGGYITRAYGNPAEGVHAVQLELSEATYMDEDPPFAFREDLAVGIRPVLHGLIAAGLSWLRRQ